MIASESQSTRISLTFCMFSDSSPFIHSLFRDLLQNHEFPVFWVSSRDSLLAYARVRTSLELMSCTITGTKESLRSEEHTSELQSLAYLVCRLLLEKKNKQNASLLEKYMGQSLIQQEDRILEHNSRTY